MTILDRIIETKKEVVKAAKKKRTLSFLKESTYFDLIPPSLKDHIINDELSGIITEFKRKSPSKGVINARAQVEEVTAGYEKAGASAISVLTDVEYFGGSNEDLLNARAATKIPILRKDFTIDEYQIYEAKSIGASAILLIAACLSVEQTNELAQCARELNLDVLLELHDEDELKYISDNVSIVGINNRNLKTFEVNLEQSARLCHQIGDNYIKIAESGISKIENIQYLKTKGFQGFLIGENFMKTNDPAKAATEFIQQIKKL